MGGRSLWTMNQPIQPTPLTPDTRPSVDANFTPPQSRPTSRSFGKGSGTVGYRTSAWDVQNRHWKGWPVVAIGLIVGALVVGANYVTKEKAEEREAVATAP